MLTAHGVGGGADLPISASSAVIGGSAALVVSFAVLLLAWPTSRFQEDRPGRAMPGLTRFIDSTATRVAVRLVGIAVLGFGLWAAFWGLDDPSRNPVFGMFYVLLWVGLVPASLLFGPVVKAFSPARTITCVLRRVIGRDPLAGVRRLPAAVGYWPAALGLLSFTWLELVSPDGARLSAVVTWFLIYLGAMVLGGLVFGEEWFESADPFEVYSTLVSRLSVWCRDGSGDLEIVAPLRNLTGVRIRPGLVAVVAVLLGSTAFDSFAGSTTWLKFTQSTTANVTLIESGLLLGACLAVAGLFWLATVLPSGSARVPAREMPGLLAHSIVPIIIGYMVAHYVTLLVETGQSTLIQASDPLGTGLNLFGTADRQVDLWLSLHPSLLATIKVAAVVIGHIVGVVAAHDKAISVLPEAERTSAQVPLLSVMVAYTFTGLYLLFGL